MRQLTKRIKQLQKIIDNLTIRLGTCSLDDFHAVQAELFKCQRELKDLEK